VEMVRAAGKALDIEPASLDPCPASLAKTRHALPWLALSSVMQGGSVPDPPNFAT